MEELPHILKYLLDILHHPILSLNKSLFYYPIIIYRLTLPLQPQFLRAVIAFRPHQCFLSTMFILSKHLIRDCRGLESLVGSFQVLSYQ